MTKLQCINCGHGDNIPIRQFKKYEGNTMKEVRLFRCNFCGCMWSIAIDKTVEVKPKKKAWSVS